MPTIATKKNKSKKTPKKRTTRLHDRPIPYVPTCAGGIAVRWSPDDVRELAGAIGGSETRFEHFFTEALMGLEEDLSTLTIALCHEPDRGELASKVTWRLERRVGVLRELFEKATHGKVA